MTAPASVVYIVPDKMGGMMNIIANLLAYRQPDGLSYHVVLTHNHLNTDVRFAQPLACDTQTTVEYTLPIENLHAVMRRLAGAIPAGPGIVVAGDLLDLAMLSVHDVGRAVILILHGDHDYYYDLAVKHDRVVHAYVAYSRRMYEQLLEHLPHRAASIHYIPYGIPLPERVRRPAAGPLRLIFAGRLEHGQKGVLELPAIAAGLRDRSIDATWTIIGDGPDGAKLRAAWPESESVRYLGSLTNADTIDRLADHDVFVLPTRVEGLPVALLEAMGCGVVPVVSNIESGVPDVVTAGGHWPLAGGRRRRRICRRDCPPRQRSRPARAAERGRPAYGRRAVRRARPRRRLPGAVREIRRSVQAARGRCGAAVRQPPRPPVDSQSLRPPGAIDDSSEIPMNAPAVSVLLTTYNRESYVAAAIESVLCQTFGDFELLIVDDCSTDRTVEIARAYERLDSRVRVVVNERNLGQFRNRNHAAELARAPLLKYHDSDDLMYPHCLSVMVPMLLSEPRAGFGLSSGSRWSGGPCPMLLTPRMAYQREFFGEGLFFCGPAGAIFRTEGVSRSSVVLPTKASRPITCSGCARARPRACCCCRPICSGTGCIRCRNFRARKARREYARVPGLIWRALQAPDCPLTPEEREQAKRNRAYHVARRTLEDVRRGRWQFA